MFGSGSTAVLLPLPGSKTSLCVQEDASVAVTAIHRVLSFAQDVLEACGRSHSLSEVYQAIEDVHAAGIGNWSLDLISGLPFASEAAWQHSLDEALAAEPCHISIYDLQVNRCKHRVR